MLEQYKTAILLAIFGTLVLAIGYFALTKAQIARECAEAKLSVAVLAASNTAWEAKTREVNEALYKLTQETERRAKESDKAVSEAKKKAEIFENYANKIMQTLPIGDECAATKRLTDNYFTVR